MIGLVPIEFNCQRCDAQLTVHVVRGNWDTEGIHQENRLAVARARAEGWQASLDDDIVLCPACSAAPTEHAIRNTKGPPDDP